MLPDVALPSEELEAVRTALLVNSTSAPQGSAFTWIVWLAIPAAAVVLALSLIFQGPKRTMDHVGPQVPTRSFLASKTHRGTVHASTAAIFTIAQAQPDEVVELHRGEITVEVAPLSASERFRVVTGDAEIEVKGTLFSAVAKDDRLMSVCVLRGLVVVRVRTRQPVTLGPNDRWEVPTVANDVRAKPPRPSLDRRIALRPTERATKTLPVRRSSEVKLGSSLSPPESAFADGWQALRSKRLAAAVTAFARAVALAGDQPLAEDALFWMAVSQARIPRPAEATASLAAFIDRFPRSPRIGEAAAMLGWLLIDEGDLDGAARRFATALRDPVDEVRRSGNEGLRAVDRRRLGDGRE